MTFVGYVIHSRKRLKGIIFHEFCKARTLVFIFIVKFRKVNSDLVMLDVLNIWLIVP